MIKGFANLINTEKYLEKKGVLNKSKSTEYSLSSIGCGTYLGKPNKEVDLQYKKAIKFAVSNGINIIDTAINYRGMRSELVVSEIIKELIEEKIINRSEVVIATKGGFLPADYTKINETIDLSTQLKSDREQFVNKEIAPFCKLSKAKLQKILERGNAIEEEVIEHLLNKSLNNLGIETIDIYYLHNPEETKLALGEDSFYKELYKTFLLLEEKVNQGVLKYYGIATYFGFIVDKSNGKYLSLEKIIEVAKKAGGDNNHFKFIQLPLNKAMQDAAIKKNQTIKGHELSIVDAAFTEKINILTNVSLNQGKEFKKYTFDEMIQYLITNEKIGSSMIGMKNISNVEKNLDAILIKE